MSQSEVKEKIAYVEHEGIKFYVQIVRVLKDYYQLTKDKRYATPLNEKQQREVERMDKRVRFEEINSHELVPSGAVLHNCLLQFLDGQIEKRKHKLNELIKIPQ